MIVTRRHLRDGAGVLLAALALLGCVIVVAEEPRPRAGWAMAVVFALLASSPLHGTLGALDRDRRSPARSRSG